ncbi:MAG: hypothetical protein GXO97_01155 [Nitrospirae bacterium]|nr:hypothetical protein [Nitrospirota bacterium]
MADLVLKETLEGQMEQGGLKNYSPEIIKQALDELLRDKRYHVASPSKKYEMLIRKCRVLNDINKKITKSKDRDVKGN